MTGPGKGFDRIKAPDRRLLERGEDRSPDAPTADAKGRAGLFSAAGQVSTPSGGGLVSVECSDCGIITPIDLGDAVRMALPLFLVAPWRSHPIFAICPNEQRRTWLRLRLGTPDR